MKMKRGNIRAIFVIGAAMGAVACGGRARFFRSLFPPGYDDDSEKVTYAYVEGLKAGRIEGDREYAAQWYRLATMGDTAHAPSWFELSGVFSLVDPKASLEFARRAYGLDTANVMYEEQLGSALLSNGEYVEARRLYSDLVSKYPQNVNGYRVLAALYQQTGQPFAAIMTLDTAESRVGRVEALNGYKLRLLLATKQYRRAEDEAERTIEIFPHDADSYLAIAEVYAKSGRDSLARASYGRAYALDSTGVETLTAMNDYYRNVGDIPNFMATTRKIFSLREAPLDHKLGFLEELKSKRDFYHDNFRQISDLAARLAILYPDSYKALDAYAESMIGYGNIEEALKLYKGFAAAMPADSMPPKELFTSIISIEGYQKRADSVVKYTTEALRYFPGNTDLYLAKGSSLAYLKEYDGARAAYGEAIRHTASDSTRGVVMGMIGDLYHQQGEVKKAYGSYRKSLHRNKNNAMALNNYAYFLAEDGRELGKALKMSEKAMSIRENYPTFIDTYAWVLYKMGRLADAKRAMQQAVALDGSNSAELAFHYGEILYALKENYMASVYWTRALERGYDREIIEARLKLVK
jgi:tetratricopeptide (TPR) repeat protein